MTIQDVAEHEIPLLPTPTVGNATGGNARRGGDRADEKLLPGIATEAASGLMPTPRATRGGSATEIAYGLGGERIDDDRPQGEVVPGIDWGPYQAAINRWVSIVGPAPSPVRHDGKGGKARLSPALPEWMMGLPEGHITGVGLTRAEELKAAGNGVVPQQAEAATVELLQRAPEALASLLAA